jgi:hypothetical protein
MVYTYTTVTWEYNECTSEKKFRRVVAVCKDLGLNANIDKYMVKIARYGLSKVRRCLRHNLCSQPYGSKSLIGSTGSAV